MPTIAEIIAAKKAAAAKFTEHVAEAYIKHPTIKPTAEDLEVEQAINRIDPLGKRRAGLVVSNKTPLQPAIIAEKAAHAENRSLSQTSGEAIPMVPKNADQEEKTWHEACNAFESELCLMRDPTDSERGWLALRLDGQEQPLLLKSFMLFDHPQTVRSQPF